MSGDAPAWRQTIITRIIDRNKHESGSHKDLIQQNNRFFDNIVQLEAENLRINVENEKLRTAVATGGKDAGGSFAVLERLLAEQKQLTELHKRKGDNSQMIVDLSMKVEEQRKIIAEKEQSCMEHIKMIQSLRAECAMLKSNLDELKKLDTTLRDEHTALHLAFKGLEDKLRNVQDENRSLLERLMKYKSKDADKLNEENESFLRKRSDKLRRDLEDAVRETRSSTSPSELSVCSTSTGVIARSVSNHSVAGVVEQGADIMHDMGEFAQAIVTERQPFTQPDIAAKFEAHETDATAVRWSPVDKLVATGGADRRVKIWDLKKPAHMESRLILGGSSAGINSVEFDSTGSFVLGTSNDYGVRLWTVADTRLRHTLTGHSGKVMAAKYIQEPHKVVTGSHDRTLKIWDLRSIACIETKFAGSSCNDLVTSNGVGSTIISGHYDKKIRFWDMRTEKQSVDLTMPAKITSLDLSKDNFYLICSVRDDTIKMIDLRKNHEIGCYSHDDFKLSCDWSRAVMNPSTSKIACGSSDGSVFLWPIGGKDPIILPGHNPFAVTAVAFSPQGAGLASVGKSRNCIIWYET